MGQDTWKWILGGLAVGALGVAASENSKKKKAQRSANDLQRINSKLTGENKILRKNYLSLLQEFLAAQNGLPKEIMNQLEDLRLHYSNVDKKMEGELVRVLDLIKNEKGEIAIEKLAKIIENMLSEKFLSEGKTEEHKKCRSLHAMLEKAHAFGWIEKREFHFSLFLKEERNKEAHELFVKFGKNWQLASFLGGIELIYKLRGVKT
jgi:hypothetical protein